MRSMFIPARNRPQIRKPRFFARIVAIVPARFEPPEKPANAIGHRADCGQLVRRNCNPAVSGARRHWNESALGLIVASVANTIQPSFIAESRYAGASMMFVMSKSVVDVMTRIGHVFAGSNPFGKLMNAWPVVGRGFAPCAASA